MNRALYLLSLKLRTARARKRLDEIDEALLAITDEVGQAADDDSLPFVRADFVPLMELVAGAGDDIREAEDDLQRLLDELDEDLGDDEPEPA